MLYRSLVLITLLSLGLLVGCGDGLSGSATGRNVSDMEALQEELSEFARTLAEINDYHAIFEVLADESLVLADDLVAQIDELIETASPGSLFTPNELREIHGQVAGRNISDLHPRWSPDGRSIVFTSNIDGNYDLYSLNADGSDVRGPATRLEQESNTDGDFSPDWSQYSVSTTPASSADAPVEPSSTGGLIAFTSDRDGNDEIYVMNPDGTGQTRLTYNPGFDGNPSWSPDGTKIAFTSGDGWEADIYVMNSDGSDQIRLTDPGWVEEMGHEGSYRPEWSPDGSTIAFTMGPGEDSRWKAVALITSDGSNQTLLTDYYNDWCNDRYCSNWGPFWAPDGRLLFYGTSRDRPNCQLINCDEGYVDPGRSVYEVSGFNSVEEWVPSEGYEIDSFEEPCVSFIYGSCNWTGDWSEYGEWPQIAWSTNGLLAYVDTTECAQLWDLAAREECGSRIPNPLLVAASSDYRDSWSLVALAPEDDSPSFSQQGTQMVFVSSRDGNEEIYVWNVDGSGPNRLTNNSGADKDPSWGPATATAPVESEFALTAVASPLAGGTITGATEPVSPSAGIWTSWVTEIGGPFGQGPAGVAVASDGSIYVADPFNGLIDKFNSEGDFVSQWAPLHLGDGEFSTPTGVAVALDGSAYVADEYNHRIQKFTPEGEFVSKWGTEGTGDGEFRNPKGVAVASDGSVYVADTNNHRIQKFTSEGDFVSQWGALDSGDGEFMYPQGVAMAPDGSVYVPDMGNNRIQKFTSEGVFVSQWGASGTGDGEFRQPGGVAVASDGSVYVADTGNHRIQKFTSAGVFDSQWATLGSGDEEFVYPFGVAVASDGSVYVSDNSGGVQQFTSEGVFVRKWGTYGLADGQFMYLGDVAVAPDGSVYVADTNNNRIQKFDADGAFVSQWGRSVGSAPNAVAVAPDGSLYVAYSVNTRIQRFTSEGVFVSQLGTQGTDVTVASDGSVYVADMGNHRIQKFTSEGVFVTKWGTEGTGDGEFRNPNGVTVASDGSVYVADSGNTRIQTFTSEGEFVNKWGTKGGGLGQFNFPNGVAVGSDGSVYVADLGAPWSDGYNNSIQKFTSEGAFVSLWGGWGGALGEFIGPNGVAVASDGSVYVADRGNGRIQKFSPSPMLVSLTAAPNAGYTFTGWSGDCSGAGECTVTMDADISVTANFALEPSGESIVFHSDRDGDYEIYAVNADGSGSAVQLTDNSAWDGDARRSPDGTKIVFTSNRHEGQEGTDIYVMNSDGTDQERLTFTYSGRSSADPSWSPDSQRIVFSSQLGGTNCSADEIYVMDVDGSNQTPLTDNADDYECNFGYPDYWDRNPSWSPDGTQIIFAAKRGEDSGIYVMNADGTGQSRLADGYLTPSWSPDGTQIAFSLMGNNGAPDIYVMDADGSAPTPLTYDYGLREAIQDLKVDRDAVMGEVLDSIKSDIEYLMTQSSEEPDLSLQLTTDEHIQGLFDLLEAQKRELDDLYEEMFGIRERLGT